MINLKKINQKSIGQILLAGSFLTLVLLLIRSAYSNLDSSWTSIRLAPSFALIKGLPLYSTADSPPWVMVGYGPLYPFMYLPAALGSTPKAVVGIATALAYLYLLMPVLLISRIFCESFKGKSLNLTVGPWSITLLFALIASLVPSLHYVLASVHVDSPALGLLLFATYFTILACRTGGPKNLVYICMSGMFVGMSISCKLNVLPSVVAFGFVVWWVLGIRRAIALIACAMLSIIVIYSWAVWTSGSKSVLLNFEVLGSFPWTRFHLADHHLGNTSELTTQMTEKIATAIITVRDYVISYGVTLFATVIIFLTGGRKFHDMRSTPEIGIFVFLIALSAVLLPS